MTGPAVDAKASLTADPTQHTAGPWGWFGGPHGFYLATVHSGRRYVMGFERMGMRYAQPTFQVSGVMVNGKDLAIFEVGRRGVVGFKAANQPGSGVYRPDVVGFDHPDARLIAAAPELLAALEAAHEAMTFARCGAQITDEQCAAARIVLEKARG